MNSLLSHDITPLASLLRPETLSDIVGQSHLIGTGKPIRKFIEAGKLPSILLWGPPGCGKTSIARVIANSLSGEFYHLSAVLAKKEDVVKIIAKAQKNFSAGRQTILFLDEIHRWTKSQQDVLLPWVEKGIVTLIGATTENPSFTVINALLSRCRTYILEPIKPEEVVDFMVKNLPIISERYPNIILQNSSIPNGGNQGNGGSGVEIVGAKKKTENGGAEPEGASFLTTETFDTFTPQGSTGGYKSMEEGGGKVSTHESTENESRDSRQARMTEKIESQKQENSLNLIARLGGGDLRNTMNLLETACILQGEGLLTRETILEAGSKSLMYDQDGEEHYNLISALHKSLRDSDGDAAIYWIGRMLAGGEDPRYIARRMMNFASEDIYDPQAIILTNSVYEICEKMGMPECELPLLNVAYYLADAPKDNRIYMAQTVMHRDIREYGNLGVPLHLRNAPTKLMKESGYGKGYEYAHNLENKKSSQEHFPEELRGRKYRK